MVELTVFSGQVCARRHLAGAFLLWLRTQELSGTKRKTMQSRSSWEDGNINTACFATPKHSIMHKVSTFRIVHMRSVCIRSTFLRVQAHHVVKHVSHPECSHDCELKWQTVVYHDHKDCVHGWR